MEVSSAKRATNPHFKIKGTIVVFHVTKSDIVGVARFNLQLANDYVIGLFYVKRL